MKAKHYSILEVLNFSEIGLTFEFYSTKEIGFIVNDLSRLSAKNVVLTNEEKFYPTYSNAILIKEYDAAKSRYKFCIAPQNYHSVLPIIDEVSKWISENCQTSSDTQLKVSLSFNHRQLETLSSISGMNPTRLILKFDENEVYTRFPNQKGSPYALSIKNLSPVRTYINESEFENNVNYILTTPYAEFFGIDFTNYSRGILECNYIGGKDYASKPKEIRDIIEYFILKTYQSINEEEHNAYEKFEIKRLTEGFDKIQMAFYDPEIYLKEFQKLKVYVDLKTSPQILKTYWNTIRGPLFEMIVNGKLREGQFNYDSDLGRCQLKHGKILGATLKEMDLVSCDVTGVLERCNFVSCTIDKARIYDSNFVRNNKISLSYLNGVTANQENEINKCYVHNNEQIINCQVNESIIKFATPGKRIKVDESSTIIVKQLPLPKKSEAVVVKEIRDYSWIKGMNKSEPKGWGNEYNKKTYLKNHESQDSK